MDKIPEEINMSVTDYLQIFHEEVEQIEEYTGKFIEIVSAEEYHDYLRERHADKLKDRKEK